MSCCDSGAEFALRAPDERATGDEVLLASRVVADGVRPGAVRGAASFARDQRIEPQNVGAPARKRMERRASHEAQADDGDVASAHEDILP
jgi:hypothetical protein